MATMNDELNIQQLKLLKQIFEVCKVSWFGPFTLLCASVLSIIIIIAMNFTCNGSFQTHRFHG